jgi:small basic protein
MRVVAPPALVAGLLAGLAVLLALRVGGYVPRAATVTGLAAAVAVAALADAVVLGSRAELTDRALFWRTAVAVTAVLAAALALMDSPLGAGADGAAAFALGVLTGAGAVAVRATLLPGRGAPPGGDQPPRPAR